MKKKISLIFLALTLMVVMVAGCQQKIGDDKYDYDYSLISAAGSDPASLGESFRMVEMQAPGTTIVNYTLAYIYSKDYVVIPKQLFLAVVSTPYGNFQIDVLAEDLDIKLTLVPNPAKEDAWKTEELGEILNKEDVVNGKVDFAVVRRVDPIIETPEINYTLGEYEELKVGHVLYQITPADGRMELQRVIVSDLLTDDETGNNLISFSGGGSFFMSYFGGPLFALRDGKLELVGLICSHVPMRTMPGWVLIYGLDIDQIIKYIETKIK